MEQVPLGYAVIGSGRVARHLAHYFSLLSIKHTLVSPRQPSSFSEKYALIAISDGKIEDFIDQHKNILQDKVLIHFSASVSSQLAISAHPLYSFGHDLYDLKTYLKIPFITDCQNKVFPGLENPEYYLPQELRPKYHALCVLANNCSTLLWQNFYEKLSFMGLPKDALDPILERTFQNLLHNPQNSLTGPLVRNDQKTIESNLTALKDDPLHAVYQTFVNLYNNNK